MATAYWKNQVTFNTQIVTEILSKGGASMPNVGAFLQRVREDFNISIKAVASSADVHRSYISRVECGEKNVTDKVIDAYVKETGCAILSMLKEHDLKVVVTQYIKDRQWEEFNKLANEMQRPQASLAAIAGVI